MKRSGPHCHDNKMGNHRTKPPPKESNAWSVNPGAKYLNVKTHLAQTNPDNKTKTKQRTQIKNKTTSIKIQIPKARNPIRFRNLFKINFSQ